MKTLIALSLLFASPAWSQFDWFTETVCPEPETALPDVCNLGTGARMVLELQQPQSGDQMIMELRCGKAAVPHPTNDNSAAYMLGDCLHWDVFIARGPERSERVTLGSAPGCAPMPVPEPTPRVGLMMGLLLLCRFAGNRPRIAQDETSHQTATQVPGTPPGAL